MVQWSLHHRKKKRTLYFFKTAIFAGLVGTMSGDSAHSIRLSSDTVCSLAVLNCAAVRASALAVEVKKRDVQAASVSLLPTISSNVNFTHLSKQPTFGGFVDETVSLKDVARLIDTGRVLDAGDYLTLGLIEGLFSGLSEPMAMAPQNISSIGVTITQPIFTGGKILNAVRMAHHSHNAQALTHQRTIDETKLAAQRFFWRYVSVIKQREALRDGEIWLRNLLSDIRHLYESGMAIELDLLNTQLQLDNYRINGMRLDNTLRTLGEQLLFFLGVDPNTEIIIDTSSLNAPFLPCAPPLPDSLENWLLFRDDLRAMDCQLEAVKDLWRLQLSSYLPTITAFASYAFTNQYSMNDEKLEANPSVGFAINWTIFDWGKAWRLAQSAKCNIKQIELMRNDLRMRIKLKYLELWRKVEEARAVVEVARQDMENSRRAMDIAQKKYEAGSIANTELLNVRSLLTQKIVSYAFARINAIVACEEYKVASLGDTPTAADEAAAFTGFSSQQLSPDIGSKGQLQ